MNDIAWTDKNYRFLMRQITRETQLYTEMVADNALLHNLDKLEHFLGRDINVEPPIAVQLGGCDPENLGEAAYICEKYGGFNEINLNCGCPSNKAKRGGFGAELMHDPELVRRIVYEMKRKTSHTDITVKCRLGTDQRNGWENLQNFVMACKDGGVSKMIVHARICILCGLSPAQNRSIPPLQYDIVHNLVRTFPDMTFILNGGIKTYEEVNQHLGLSKESSSTSKDVNGAGDSVSKDGTINTYNHSHSDTNNTEIESKIDDQHRTDSYFLDNIQKPVKLYDIREDNTANNSSSDIYQNSNSDNTHGEDASENPFFIHHAYDPSLMFPPVHGIMIGREAYNNPWCMANVDSYYYNKPNPGYTRKEVLDIYLDYCSEAIEKDDFKAKLSYLTQPLHNYFNGCNMNKMYKRKLDHLVLKYSQRCTSHKSNGVINNCVFSGEIMREMIMEAIEDTIPEYFMEQYMGPDGEMISKI
jgi:tRNA-dihydrouridine synthase